MSTDSQAAQQARHPIGVVVARTGLSFHVLRAWERRYQTVTPVRTPGGQRLYSDADIERLRLLRRAVEAGRSIGRIARLPTEELAELVAGDAQVGARVPFSEAARPAPLRAAAYLAESIAAVDALDPRALDSALRQAELALEAETLLEELIAPLLREIGDRWHQGMVSVAQEHAASAVIRRRLDSLLEVFGGTAESSLLVAATLQGERHEFGVLLAAAAAAVDGWRIAYLGPDLPGEEIAAASARAGADVVAISLIGSGDPDAAADQLRRLREALPRRVEVVVGGAQAPSQAAAIAEIGALGPLDLREFRDALAQRRGQLPPRRPATDS